MAPLFQLVGDPADISFPVPDLPGSRRPIFIGGIPTGAVVTRSARQDEDRLIDRAVTWRLGAEANVGRRTFLYANGESGYRPGGFNAATGFETFEPERITAYTMGLRHRSSVDRFQLDLEAFWWNYRDQQVSSLRPDLSSPPRNANITDNIGNSRIRGIEADARVRPWAGGQLGAIVQLLDADYRSFEYTQASTGVRPLTGCEAALSPVANLYTIDCSAKQPYNSPRWSMTLSGRHSFPLGDFTFTFAADTHFRSARNIGFAFLPEQRIGSSWTSNAQVILGGPEDSFRIAAFVRNIEGTRIPQFMIYHPVSNALVAGTSAPRQWGIRGSLRL
jgi:iron complex outermembrane receptor protein